MTACFEIKPIHIRTYAGVQDKKKLRKLLMFDSIDVHPYGVFYLIKQFTFTAGQIRISEQKWE